MNPRPLLIALCLCGCAPSLTELQRQLIAFEGRPVTAMIERFGAPQQQTEINGQRWYIWSASKESFPQAYWMGYENDPTYVASCKVSARVSEDVVRQVLREGNLEDCKILGLT